MKILVTGANGYLGHGIVRDLLDNGHQVTAVDVSAENIDKRAEIIKCDLFAPDDPFEHFGRPENLLHLAWRDGFVHYSPSHVNDLPDHYHFLEKMVKSGLKKLTIMGSMHEIGFFEGCIKDGTPCNPTTPYGICKNALRELAQVLCNKYNVTFQWLRGYYIVGNSEKGNSVFSKISLAEKEGKTEFPFTLGQNKYDFLSYDDFCRFVSAAVAQDEVNGIINICSGCPEKLADRVERFIAENEYKIRLKYGAFPDRPYDSKAVWGDNSKISRIMNNT